jgi:hypothetical protein
MGSNCAITKYAPKTAFFTVRGGLFCGSLIYGGKMPGNVSSSVLIFARKSRESGDIRLFFAESFGG